jgi:UDP-N-acetyl-D-mannosaminuronic acid transferase (WecB/TagA/CpsF family)
MSRGKRDMRKIEILDIGIHSMERNEALDTAEELIISGKGGMIFTPNPAMIEYARKDKEFFRILNSASLSLCDAALFVSSAARFAPDATIATVAATNANAKIAARLLQRPNATLRAIDRLLCARDALR